MGEWRDGWVHRWVDGRIDGGCVHAWVCGWTGKSLGLRIEVEAFTRKAGLGRRLLGGRLECVLGQGRRFMSGVIAQRKLRF